MYPKHGMSTHRYSILRIKALSVQQIRAYVPDDKRLLVLWRTRKLVAMTGNRSCSLSRVDRLSRAHHMTTFCGQRMPTPGGQGRSTSREQSANGNSQEDSVEVTDSGQNNTQEEQEAQEYNSSSEEESECDYSM